MIEKDTVRLLRECDAGVKMGVSSIDDVYRHVHSTHLRYLLDNCRAEHERLGNEIGDALTRFGDDGKRVNPLAKKMSKMKTGMMLMMNRSDSTVADLMTDGCNMGVKSLNKYLNRYEAADEHAKDITKKLINLEQKLTSDIRGYL